MDKPHIRINEEAALAVGMEKVELLRKDGKTISFDVFVTNGFENKGGQWLLVAHQATPVFKPPESRAGQRRRAGAPADRGPLGTGRNLHRCGKIAHEHRWDLVGSLWRPAARPAGGH
jgi:hypothetical protein